MICTIDPSINEKKPVLSLSYKAEKELVFVCFE